MEEMGKGVMWMVLVLLAISAKWTSGLLCYSCKNLKSNELCFNVTECPGGEACFGRADGLQTAEVKHSTGCTKELIAPSLTGSNGYTFCTKTCREDLCNLHKCQLGNKTRSPRCLSCEFIDHPDNCKNVTECQSGEVCFAEKHVTFNKIKYRLGCVRDQDCNSQPMSSLTILGKRASPNHCSVCCKTDHCNLNACNSNAAGQIFQLKSLSPGATCADSDPKMCATLGRFNAGACGDPYVVKSCTKSCVTCDHAGWTSWQAWGHCSNSCGSGTMTRTRFCHHRLNINSQQMCVGNSIDTKACMLKNCPIAGGWCYYTTQSCNSYSDYCSTHRHRGSCNCPAPKYGGRSC